MPVSRLKIVLVLLGLMTLGLLPGPGFATASLAADGARGACLSKVEQRAAVATQQAVPLSQAIRSLHARGRRAEVVRAELCDRGGRLVYLLTLLPRSGKVTRATIDAASGEPVGVH